MNNSIEVFVTVEEEIKELETVEKVLYSAIKIIVILIESLLL